MEVAADAADQLAGRLQLLAGAGLLDHEGLGVVGLLAELLQSRDEAGGGGVVAARPHEVQVEELLGAAV